MPAGWQTVRVFISSTFKDMQAERDHLVRFVFPRLRAELLKRRVHLVDVDLRWGVTSEQDALSVCREIIDECRPRFLCILGGRYGWTPPGEERSITADEVYYAALDETEPGGYEFFYFRDPAATESIPEDVAREGGYREFPTDEDAARFGAKSAQELAAERTRKLETLKQAVRDADLPVFDYPCRWDARKQRLVDFQAFGNAVYRDLIASIDDELGAEPPEAPDWFAEEDAAVEAFIEERTEHYVVGSRQALLDDMTAHADGSDGPATLVVTGQPGSGKSALLGHFYRDYVASHPDEIVIPHFVGASRGSTSIRETLRRLCRELAQAAGIDEDIPEDVRELASLFPQLLERTAGRELTDDDGGGLEARPTPEEDRATRPVVIIIDALNQLDATDNAHALTWLPVALPEGVRIICSSLEHPALDALRRRGDHIRVVACEALTRDDAGAIMDATLARYSKRFDDAQRSALLAKPDAGVPLYLLAALEELRTLGTYELITGRIEQLPGTVTELFDWILRRLERGEEGQEAFGEPLVSTYTASIAVGRGGMTESELAALCAPVDEEDEFWVLHRMLRPYLMSRGELIDYFHGQLREAVERRYLPDNDARRQRHTETARLLHDRADPLRAGEWRSCPALAEELRHSLIMRALTELPYHVTAADEWATLEGVLTDLRFAESKAESGMVFDLAEDFTAAVDATPRERPLWKHLRLLNQALRNDLHFISRHPSTLFQCFWNSGWWYDCDDAAKHYDPPEGGWGPSGAPWERPEPRLCTLLERWRREKEARQPGFYWVRSLRPPPQALGGAQIACFAGHEGRVASVAFSPGGRRLASGSKDCTVRVWDIESGAEKACLRKHEDEVTSVAFSPDGRRLASGSHDRMVRVWDGESEAEVACLRGHEGGVTSVAFSPDGRRLASGSYDQTVRVWDTESGAEVACLQGQEGAVTSVAFSPDGRRLASGEATTVRVWDIESRAQVACLRGHKGGVESVAFSPDGRRLASGSFDKTVRVWDGESGDEVACLRMQEGQVWSVAFSPDGRRLASGIGSEFGHLDDTVRVWESENWAEVACLRGHEDLVKSVAFSPDGRRLASGSGGWPTSVDSSVRVWDIESGAEVGCLRGHERDVTGVAFSPDGRRLASGSCDKTVRVWGIESGAEVACLRGHESTVEMVVFSPDGARMASGGGMFDKTVRVWDSESGAEVACLHGHGGGIYSVAFSPDERWLGSGSGDKTVRVWDSESGAEIACLRGHVDSVNSVAFSPDGRRLASGAGSVQDWPDYSVRVWDSESGAEVACLRGHEDEVKSVAFSPDGRRVASGGDDRTVRVWNSEGGAEAACLRGHERGILSVTFSPDGRRLASGDSTTVRVWDAQTYECLEIVEGAGDVAAIATGPPSYPWRALARGLETLIEDTHHAAESASFAVAPGRIATAASGRTWAGAVANHVVLFALEGDPRAAGEACGLPE